MRTNTLQKLPPSFYQQRDVVGIARALLGKVLVTAFDGQQTTGRIVETEAYAGEQDRASHAYKGRTARTDVMYRTGGYAYVYLCYGMHHLFNVVTGPEGLPHAVLIRAVEPLTGTDTMLRRRGKQTLDATLTSGPGRVGKAFGLHTAHSGCGLQGNDLFLADDGFSVQAEDVVASPRVGVAYAGDHAAWPYRFYLRGNRFVSNPRVG